MTKKEDTLPLTSWVLAAQAGERGAIDALIAETQDRLYKFCFVLSSNRALADDLCQESYLRALVKIRNLRDPAQFISWLFRIAKNVYLDQWRSQKAQMAGVEKLTVHSGESSVGDEASNVIAIRQALSQFEAKDRYLLSLIDLAEFTYAEAAEILGESEAAVKSRVFRLRKSFLKILNGD